MIRSRVLTILLVTPGFVPQLAAAPCASACQLSNQAKKLMKSTPAHVKFRAKQAANQEDESLPPCHRQVKQKAPEKDQSSNPCGLGDCLVVDQLQPPQILSLSQLWPEQDHFVLSQSVIDALPGSFAEQAVRLVLAQHAPRPPNVPLRLLYQVFLN